jgi:arachidonate 15-lipoxygenase
MVPSLPQQDTNLQARQDYLARHQREYQYNYTYLAPCAILAGNQATMPDAEKFSTEYKIRRQLTRIQADVNAKLVEWRSRFDPIDQLEDYDDIYVLFPKPKQIVRLFPKDQIFAEQRLSGANPMAIRLLKPDDDRAKILLNLAKNHQKLAERLDVPAALAQGNLYITDYTGRADGYTGPLQVKGGTFGKNGPQKYLPKCRGFFWWNGQELVPIVIQLNDGDVKIYTCCDAKLDWFYAKLCLQVADANQHELVTHLGQVHLVMEPFAIATQRQLAANHPLSLLLRPHFRFMLGNNNLAQEKLINHNGPVDKAMAGTLDESFAVVKAGIQAWRLDQAALPVALANRGVEDVSRLPHFPYRDDAMRLWQAIERYVTAYIGYFYPDAATVQADSELQRWAAEITAQDGGRIQGMPSQIESATELSTIITNLIFIVGPQHAAVNFSQYDYMTFAANMPLAAYREPIIQENPVTVADILAFLPPPAAVSVQFRITYLLAAYRYDQLGDYRKTFKDLYKQTVDEVFANTPIPGVIERFQADLRTIEQEIDQANRSRIMSYPYLKPSLIPNSTSI